MSSGFLGLDKTLRVDSQSALAIAIGQGQLANPPPKGARQLPSESSTRAGEIIPVYLVTKALAAGRRITSELKRLPSARILELAAIWGLLEHGTSRPRERWLMLRPTVKPELWCSGTVAQQDLQLSTLAVVSSLLSGCRCFQPGNRRGRGLVSTRVTRCRFDAGSVHHLHWCLLHCSVGVLEVVPSRCHRPAERQGQACRPSALARHASYSAFEIKPRRPSRPRSLHVRRQQARSL